MIQLSSLSKRFADRVLLDTVTWYVGDRDRVGLCGPNGAGKTTLLRMLAGFDEPDGGEVIRPSALTIGYLPQDGLTHAGRTVFAEASDALRPLLDLKAEMHDLEHRLADGDVPAEAHDAMLERYSAVQERFRIGDGYSIELRVATILRGLGFTPADFETQAEHLSGGWQMRLALAKLLLREPGLLLLDEPTNHLDLEARNWLEDYLARYPHAVILVSHDRYFLDAVVDRIADLSLRTITDYVCNYSQYLVQRDERLERLREAKRRQDDEIERVQQFVDRFRYQATKAAQVQSRIKMLDKIERIEVPPARKRIHFQFPAAMKSGRVVLELQRRAPGLWPEGGARRGRPPHRARRSGGAGRAQRRRQIDADAAAGRGGAARRRPPRRRPPGGHAVLRAGRSHPARSGAHRLRDPVGRLADAHGAGDPQHPRRLPLRRR